MSEIYHKNGEEVMFIHEVLCHNLDSVRETTVQYNIPESGTVCTSIVDDLRKQMFASAMTLVCCFSKLLLSAPFTQTSHKRIK